MPQTPELRPARRRALVVATGVYDDPALRRLRAPAQDAAALAEVLADQGIGAFAVTRVEDRPVQEIRVAIGRFLATSELNEVTLVYLSCHGLLDATGELYFAATDTDKEQLTSTALEAAWLRARLQECRAKQQLVLLDCCFSGAFVPHGKGPGGMEVPIEGLHGGGRGHVVLTASRATEYSLEGTPSDDTEVVGSIFTSALVQGLRTGAADFDNDGLVSTDDAFHYIKQYVLTVGAKQTPQRSIIRSEGNIMLGYSPVGIRPVAPATTVVPAQARESLAEVAEIVTARSTGTASGSDAVAVGSIPEGPAGELAMLRAISRVLDAPEALAEVVRSRSVADVVKLVAAVRVTGLGDRAADPLRTAALVRPVADVIALVDAVRAAAHPTDAEVLLAAAASTRAADDVAQLCVRLTAEDRADDLAQVVRWAARTRPLGEVFALVDELVRADRAPLASDLLAEAGEARPIADVAELVARARSEDRLDGLTAVLDGVRRRPMGDAAHLVVTLRVAGDNDAVDRILLWVRDLPADQIAALVAGLRREGAADEADVTVRWMGWQLDTETLAGLVGALKAAGLGGDAAILVGAVTSGTAEGIAEFALALHRAGDTAGRGEVLARAAERPVGDVARLLTLLEPERPTSPYRTGAAEPEAHKIQTATAGVLAGYAARRPVMVVRETLAAVDGDARQRLLQAIGRAPTAQVIDLLGGFEDVDASDEVNTVVGGATARPPADLVELFEALQAAGRAKLVSRVAGEVGRRYPGAQLPKVLVRLEKAQLGATAASILNAVPEHRWGEMDAGVLDQLVANRGLVRQLSGRHRRAQLAEQLAEWLGTVLAYGATLVGLLVLAAVIAIAAAALSRLFAEPHLNNGEWAALVPTTLAVGVILFVIVFRLYRWREFESDGQAIAIVWAMLFAFTIGFVGGFVVDDVRDLGMTVREWLAWNFLSG